MKPVLFAKDATSYDNNGIGILHDALRCDVYEEYNGIFDVELEYPSDGEWANEITDQRQILAKPNDIDQPHAFRIYEIEKDLVSGVIFARGTSITDDLGGNLITALEVENLTPQQVFDRMKSKLIEPTRFDFVSDIDRANSAKWVRVNPLSAINGTDNSMVSLWGGDLKRTNRTVYLYSRRGRNKATTIRPGKNIDGFNMVTSDKGVITKILPYYTYRPVTIPQYQMVKDYNDEWVKEEVYTERQEVREEDITVEGSVVISPLATQYANQRYTPIDFSRNEYINETIDQFVEQRLQQAEESPTPIDNSGFPEELRQFVVNLLNQEAGRYFEDNPDADKPKVNIRVDMIELADSDEWEKFKALETIQVTDTVDVYVKKFDVDIEVSIQSIRYDSLGEKVLEIVAGSAQTSLVKDANRPFVNKVKELENYIDSMENGVYNTIGRTADGQNRRFSGYTEPPASISEEGDLWFKEVGNGQVETYIFKGGMWEQVVGAQRIEAIQREIDDAKAIADNAEEKAQTTIDDINDALQGTGKLTLADLIASKVATDEYETLFYQQADAIGLVYQEDGQTKAIIGIADGIPYIKGEHVVLDGNTIVDGTFTVTESMLADEAVIQKLMATGIDAKDVTIVNLDASNIATGDLEISDSMRITYAGQPIIEVVNGSIKITAPNLASKKELEEAIEEIELLPGPKGEDAWKVEIISTNGNIFRHNTINTVLDARVYKGGEDITEQVPASKFIWKRVSEDQAGDEIWNQRYFGGTKTITVTSEDVYRRATFYCEVLE